MSTRLGEVLFEPPIVGKIALGRRPVLDLDPTRGWARTHVRRRGP